MASDCRFLAQPPGKAVLVFFIPTPWQTSLGFSPNDIVGLITLTSRTYKGWRDACSDYADITGTLDCLYLLLRRLETHVPAETSSEPGFAQREALRQDLGTVIRGVRNTVDNLDKLLDKYPSLSRSKSKNWERIQWGAKDLNGLRSRLTQHVSSISAFLNVVELESIGRLGQDVNAMPDLISQRVTIALGNFIDAREADNRSMKGDTVMTSYSNDDIDVWRQFRSECVKSGIKSNDLKQYEPDLKRFFQSIINEKQTAAAKSSIAKSSGTPPHRRSSRSLRGEDFSRQRPGNQVCTPVTEEHHENASAEGYLYERGTSGQSSREEGHFYERRVSAPKATKVAPEYSFSYEWWSSDYETADDSSRGSSRARSEARRRRSRSRRRAISADDYQINVPDHRHQDPEYRNRRIAQGGLAAAAAAGILDRVDRRSHYGRRISKDRPIQSIPVAVAGVVGPALASLYERNAASKVAERHATVVQEADDMGDAEQRCQDVRFPSAQERLNADQGSDQFQENNVADTTHVQNVSGVPLSNDARNGFTLADASPNSLNELRTKLPIRPVKEAGEDSSNDARFLLCFESQVVNGTKTNPPGVLPVLIPSVPVPPERPRLSETEAGPSALVRYTTAFGHYVSAFHAFDEAMMQHFAERRSVLKEQSSRAPSWLSDRVFQSGHPDGEAGFNSYMLGIREDKKYHENWSLAWSAHLDAIALLNRAAPEATRHVHDPDAYAIIRPSCSTSQ